MRFMYGYLTTIFNIIWLKRYYLEYLLTLSYLGGISFQVVRIVPGRLGCHQRLPVMLYRFPHRQNFRYIAPSYLRTSV